VVYKFGAMFKDLRQPYFFKGRRSMKPTVSVIIITKNEARNIEDCLKSVAWADEIVVVDSGSDDETVEICRQYTDKIVVTDWPGYGIQKQRALDQATSDWVLSLDADERVTPKLQQEIQVTLPTTSFDGFEIYFKSEYCGKVIHFGDWTNDRQAVLFRRTKGRFVSDLVHERIEIQGTIGKLKGIIEHLAFRDLNMVLRKLNDYSNASAQQKYLKGQKASLWTAITHGLWTFLRGYVLRMGFLDGKEGFLLAVSNAEGTYYRYLKLMYLNRKERASKAINSSR
jgi:glycosyltransferase involved in cell wall biosynthesis